MRDSEIRESADPLRVLQRTREKQNEELVRLTLAVALTEGLEQRLQLLLQTTGRKLSNKNVNSFIKTL